MNRARKGPFVKPRVPAKPRELLYVELSICQTVQTPYGTFAVHGVNQHGEPVPAQGRLILQPQRGT